MFDGISAVAGQVDGNIVSCDSPFRLCDGVVFNEA